jgi:hypothetical protein
MINQQLAKQLKAAGLAWEPAEHDFFSIPFSEMENKVFIISEFTALVQPLHGQPAITFHGSSEWALDFILVAETLWLPTEQQLREQLERRLDAQGAPELTLVRRSDGYECVVGQGRGPRAFSGPSGAAAYAAALLYLLGGGKI